MCASAVSGRQVAALSPGLARRLGALRHLALDLDGTLYRGSQLFGVTLPFIATLRELGIGHTFVTNNSSRSLAEYVAKLRRLGLPAAPDQVMISTHAALEFLRQARPDVRRLFVLGTPAMAGELEAAGYVLVPDDPGAEPDAVIVAFDPTVTYARLCRAAWWIRRGRYYLATNPDYTCPTDEPTVLVDCGALCAALQAATGRAPDVIAGKPHGLMLRGLLQRRGLQPHELAMVGDRLMTDAALARSAGVLGVIVLSGEATLADTRAAADPPDLVVADVGELGHWLRAARHS